MKKYSFIFVLVFMLFISVTTSAYSVRSTADIQGFFNSTSGGAQDKLKDSINALNFHSARLQNELQNSSTTPGRSGMIYPKLSAYPVNGTVLVATSTPIFEIEFYATGSPMTVERINLQVKVKSNGIEENPSLSISSLYITGGNTMITIPVNSNTFTKDTTSIPGQTIYYVQLAGLGLNVPISNLSKFMTIYANVYPSTNNREVTTNVYSGQGIRAVDTVGVSSYYGLQGSKTLLIKPAVSLPSEAKIVVAGANLVTTTVDSRDTGMTGTFKLDATGLRNDVFIHKADVVLRNAQTGAEILSTSSIVIPNDYNDAFQLMHRQYGNILVSRVPENSIKRLSATTFFAPKGMNPGVYFMEIKKIYYFDSTLMSTYPASSTLKSVSLVGQANTQTNTTYYEGNTPTTVANLLTMTLSSGSQNGEVKLLQNFLIAKGYSIQGKDTYGLFGDATKSALISFQMSKSITPADGSTGPLTRSIINAEITGSSTTATTTRRRVVLPPVITGSSTSGQVVPLPTAPTSFFKSFFKNAQAQTLQMFKR